VHPVFKWLWKSSCQNKHKIFFWFLLKDRLGTRDLLKRRNMELEDYTCVLCDRQADESAEHLFLSCPFAMDCWDFFQLRINTNASPFSNLEQLRNQIRQPFFMEIIMLICWAI
jgi:hypothetical protein